MLGLAPSTGEAPETTSLGKRVVLVMAFVVAGLALVAAVAAFVRGREWAASAHRENYQQLAIVAQSIESWPNTVHAMAKGNLLRSRLDAPWDARLRYDEGWQAAARIEHADVGTIELRYRLAAVSSPTKRGLRQASPCRDYIEDEDSVRIRPEDGELSIEGSLAIQDIWQADSEAGGDSKAVGEPSAAGFKALIGNVDPQQASEALFAISPATDAKQRGQGKVNLDPAGCPVFQYETAIPLARIADIARNAPDFQSVGLVGANGKILTSLGSERLAARSLDEVVPSTKEEREVITTLLKATASGKPLANGTGNAEADDSKEARQRILLAQRSARPVKVVVAGIDYIAYFRPLSFAGDWKEPDCSRSERRLRGDKSADDPADNDKSSPDTGPTFAAPVDSCLLIGLVPASKVRAQTFALSTDLLTAVAIVLVFTVMLVPAVKLRFLGPAGDMTVLEVVIAVLGLFCAAAVVTLAAFATYDALHLRAQSEARLDDVSATLASDFQHELKAAVERPIRLGIPARAEPLPRVDLVRPETIACSVADAGDPQEGRTQSSRAESRVFAALPRIPEKKEGADHAANFSPREAAAKLRHALAWPVRDQVSAFGELGRAFPGLLGVAYQCNAGGRANVSSRAYFQRAMSGETDGVLSEACSGVKGMHMARAYSIDAVRSQTDGLAKVVVANRFWLDAPDGARDLPTCRDAWLGNAFKPGGPRSGVVTQAFVARTFLASVLPRSFRFIVVDSSDPRLPYLFGTAAHEIGISSLRQTLPSAGALERIGLAVAGECQQGLCPVQRFASNFDGSRQSFVARRLYGTSWVLLVYRPPAELDRRVASTVGLAALVWAGGLLSVVLVLVALSYLAKRYRPSWLPGKRARLWLWPRPESGPAMKQAGQVLVVVSGLCLALLLSIREPVFLAAITLLLPFCATIWAVLWLGRAYAVAEAEQFTARRLPRALLPSDERGFLVLFCGLLLACGVVPAAACWVDADTSATEFLEAREAMHLKDAWKDNRRALAANARTYDLHPNPKAPSKGLGRPDAGFAPPAWPGLYGFRSQPDAHVPGGPPFSATAQLRQWMGMGDEVAAGHCAARAGGFFCVQSNDPPGLNDDTVELVAGGPALPVRVDWPGLFTGAAFLAGLVTALVLICCGITRSLFGFRIALDAVRHPGIQLDGFVPLLPSHAVVLNGPLALTMLLLEEGVDPLDISQSDGRGWVGSAEISCQLQRLRHRKTVVVTGLDIALKDPAIRVNALNILELLARVAGKEVDEKNRNGSLVVMTDLSPLDRVLRAYEREQDERHKPGAREFPTISRTEQLRWSKLFEDFKTCTLPVQPKFLWNRGEEDKLRTKLKKCRKPGEIDGIVRLIEEVRFLPEGVIHSLIRPREIPNRGKWKHLLMQKRIDRFPVDPETYDLVYGLPAMGWAIRVSPATAIAAEDYLRGEVIEHYQHVWAASSHAERVILDNLAHGRVINIKSALAIRSLIRRGLVKMAPAPMIFNNSFGIFVRQAEKPETLRKWRREQPKGGWERIARPLGYVLPAVVVVLAGLALLAGESLLAVVTIILSAGPALLSTIIPGRRAG